MIRQGRVMQQDLENFVTAMKSKFKNQLAEVSEITPVEKRTLASYQASMKRLGFDIVGTQTFKDGLNNFLVSDNFVSGIDKNSCQCIVCY